MTLVADDQVTLELLDGALIARAPSALRGKMEVRGQGIIELVAAESAAVALIAELVPASQTIERMPDPVGFTNLCGCRLPVLRLQPFEASAPAKLLVALTMGYGR
jgi:HPr kinase/phosphorylase